MTDFVTTRLFDAPRDLVWPAFTEEQHLRHWWGPVGFALRILRFEPRLGGIFHYAMRAANGYEMFGRWVFRELTAPERLSFVFGFTDEAGHPVRHPMAPTWPLEMLGTATFATQGTSTLLTHRITPLDASDLERRSFEAGFASMEQGFGGTWNQLAAYLAKA